MRTPPIPLSSYQQAVLLRSLPTSPPSLPAASHPHRGRSVTPPPLRRYLDLPSRYLFLHAATFSATYHRKVLPASGCVLFVPFRLLLLPASAFITDYIVPGQPTSLSHFLFFPQPSPSSSFCFLEFAFVLSRGFLYLRSINCDSSRFFHLLYVLPYLTATTPLSAGETFLAVAPPSPDTPHSAKICFASASDDQESTLLTWPPSAFFFLVKYIQ